MCLHSSVKHWARTRTIFINNHDHEARNISTNLHIAAVPKELTLDYSKSSVDQMHLLALADTLASCSATHLVTSTIAIGASKNLSKSGIYCITRHNVWILITFKITYKVLRMPAQSRLSILVDNDFYWLLVIIHIYCAACHLPSALL